MDKVIITGANGAGKSFVAAKFAEARPEVPLISFDKIKLRTGWKVRELIEVERALLKEIERNTWILEGGPSVLPLALNQADALIWIDPPTYKRAWRLFLRPLRSFGKSRSEMPSGNIDWPLQQYRFALRSLLKSAKFRRSISHHYDEASNIQRWHCIDERSVDSVLRVWRTENNQSES